MDIELAYEEKGAGAPLILLHGNGENRGYFSRQTGFFSRYFRVIALDTRGHGASPRGDAPFTIEQFASDLLGFMDERGIERAHILGFSDGGNIALTFALTHPDRVDRLILNGANLRPSGVKLMYQLPIICGYLAARPFADKSPEARRKAELLRLMVKEPCISPGQLRELRVRTLVMAGTRDMIKPGHTRLIFDSIPEAELSLLPGDHFIAAGNPDEFNRAALAFLTKA